MLTALAEHYDFDVHTPFNKLSKKIQEIILHGSGRTEIEFKYINDRGDIRLKKHPFEGILHNLERRYRDTESTRCVRSWQNTSPTSLAAVVMVRA